MTNKIRVRSLHTVQIVKGTTSAAGLYEELRKTYGEISALSQIAQDSADIVTDLTVSSEVAAIGQAPTLVFDPLTKNLHFTLIKGDKGDSIKGDQGDSIIGPKGDAGADSTVVGPKGDKGDQGDTGPAGADSTVAGPKGDSIIGPKGYKGDTGSQSTVPGPKGDKGNTGTAGTNGTNGVDGNDGAKGDKGDKGDTGLTGAASTVAGPKGDKGDTGLTGAASTVAGPKGDTGAASTVAGPKGDKGDPGSGYDGETEGTVVWTGSQSGTLVISNPNMTPGGTYRIYSASSNTSSNWTSMDVMTQPRSSTDNIDGEVTTLYPNAIGGSNHIPLMKHEISGSATTVFITIYLYPYNISSGVAEASVARWFKKVVKVS